jgi:hypothetical protein
MAAARLGAYVRPGAVTWRLVGLFCGVMAAAGLAVQAIFSAAGLIPQQRSAQIVPTSFDLNYTSVLNVVFLGVIAYLIWLYRSRARQHAH